MSTTPRTADTVFTATFREPQYFEDLTERCALKLTSMLRATGRPHYTLWEQAVGGAHFKERTGQFAPIYYMDIEVTDAPIVTREPLAIDVEIRLGKHLRGGGEVELLLSEGRTRVSSPGTDGRPVAVGRTLKQSVFTHPDADPARRRVTRLHPSLGLGEVPEREIRPVTEADLLGPPPGYRRRGDADPSFADADWHTWSYQQTDPNRHVHAMDYVRVLESFAGDHLARLGRSPREWVVHRVRILFRRPCFTGEGYRRTATLWQPAAGDEDLLIAAIHPTDLQGRPLRGGRPATIAQLVFGPSPARPGAGTV
jgi:hypothetical protein